MGQLHVGTAEGVTRIKSAIGGLFWCTLLFTQSHLVYAWSIFRIPVEKTFGIGATQSGLPYMISLTFYALFMS